VDKQLMRVGRELVRLRGHRPARVGREVRGGRRQLLADAEGRKNGEEWGVGDPVTAARGGEGVGCPVDVRAEWGPRSATTRPRRRREVGGHHEVNMGGGAGGPVGGPLVWAGPTNSSFFNLFNILSNENDFIRSKDGLPKLKKIQIKYLSVGN
jgi:hypothetical protein